MPYAMLNLLNTNIQTYSADTEGVRMSFVFIGSILKEHNTVRIQTLDMASPDILSKAINIYKANRLAQITQKGEGAYILVHADLLSSLPEKGFCLFCQNQVIRYKFAKENKNLAGIDSESYQKLGKTLDYWMADARKAQNPSS